MNLPSGFEKLRSRSEVQRSTFAKVFGCAVFDFCNSIGTNRTNRAGVMMSVVRGRAEARFGTVRTVVDPTETFRFGAQYMIHAADGWKK
jgi:hypothetical protein